MKITAVYFSATRTTKKIITAFVQEWKTEVVHYDLINHPIQTDLNLNEEDLLVVGMPVYAGRIPTAALSALQHVKGRHTPTILLAVYGNREWDDILVEMQDLLEGNGCNIVGAGTFIAQHSIFPHTAKGRPDQSDMDKVKEFAQACQQKLANGIDENDVTLPLPGNRPYKTPGKIPLKIVTNQHCTTCGTCAKTCPVSAIPMDNPRITDDEKCIHCGHCIKVCPEQARGYGGLLYKVAGAVFGWKNRKRKEPQWWL